MTAYREYLETRHKMFEDACSRCGACCGSQDDPCSDLVMTADGTYYCRVYASRFGEHTTVSGKKFNCVDIREHIAAGTLREGCGYSPGRY